MATDTDLASRPSATPTLMDTVADAKGNGLASKDKEAIDVAPDPAPGPRFTQARKWTLLGIFALAIFIDGMFQPLFAP